MRRLVAIVTVVGLALVGCGDDDDQPAAPASFCDRAEAFDEQFAELEEQLDSTGTPTGEAFVDVADAIDELAEDAPDGVRDDVEAVAVGVRAIADVLGDVDLSDAAVLDDPAVAAELSAMSDRLEELSDDVEEASDRVEDYLRTECGGTAVGRHRTW